MLQYLAVATGLALPTTAWSSEPAALVLRFVIAYAVLIVLPGLVLTGLLCRAVRPLDRWTLSLILGMVSSSVVYWFACLGGRPDLYWVWPAATALPLIARRRELLEGLFEWRLDASHVLLAAVIAVTLAVLLTSPAYWSLRPQSDGTMTRPFGDLQDFEFHLAIVRELMHSVPPQSPFTAGTPLHYHYAPDLTVALLARTTRLDVGDLLVRLLPPLFLVQAVLSVFCFARAWLGSGNIASLVAGLTVLAGDLSWVVGACCPDRRLSHVGVFQTPTFLSLFVGNAMLPALGVLFAGLFALARACQAGEWAWVGTATLLLGALMQYKVFAGVQVAAALGVAAIWTWLQRRDPTLIKIAAPVGILAAGSLAMLKMGGQASPQDFRLAPLWLLEATADMVCFFPGMSTMTEWPAAGRFVFLLAVVLPFYLIGSFGPRLLGWRAFTAPLRSRGESSDPRFAFSLFLSLSVIIGLIATAAVRITPRDEPGAYNNSVWFLIHSKYIMWIFAGEALMVIDRGSRRKALAAATVVSVLGLPSVFAWAQSTMSQGPPILDREQAALIRSLEQVCREGTTVLGPPDRSDEPSFSPGSESELLLLAGCRVPLAGPFASQFISQDDWKRRKLDVRRFWKSWRKGWLRQDILDRYDARYVVERLGDGPRPVSGLQPIFAGADYFVYSVADPAVTSQKR